VKSCPARQRDDVVCLCHENGRRNGAGRARVYCLGSGLLLQQRPFADPVKGTVPRPAGVGVSARTRAAAVASRGRGGRLCGGHGIDSGAKASGRMVMVKGGRGGSLGAPRRPNEAAYGTAADAQEEAGQLQGQDSNKNCTSVMQMMRRPPSLHTSERRNCARPAGGVCCCSALAWACRGRWEPSCSGVVAFGRLIGPVSLVGLQAVTGSRASARRSIGARGRCRLRVEPAVLFRESAAVPSGRRGWPRRPRVLSHPRSWTLRPCWVA
jgi:hypothetical protein